MGEERCQPVDADELGGAAAEDREHARLRDALGERLLELLHLDRLVAEIALHEIVVGDDDAFDERVVHRVLFSLHLVGDRALRALPAVAFVGHRGVREEVDDAPEGSFFSDRQLEWGDPGAELRLQLVERPGERRPFTVKLVHEHRARDLGLLRHPPGHLGLHLDAFHRRDDEDNEIGGSQRGGDVADEVGVPGGVEQVYLVAVVLERGDGHRNGDVSARRLGVEVGHRVAILDAPNARNRTDDEQQRLGQARLARPSVTHQRDVADLRRRIRLQADSPSLPPLRRRKLRLCGDGRPSRRRRASASGVYDRARDARQSEW